MPRSIQYRRNLLETKNDLLLDEMNQQPSYARYIDYTLSTDGEDVVISGKRRQNDYEKTGKPGDMFSADGEVVLKDGAFKKGSGNIGVSDGKLGVEVGGSYSAETGGATGNIKTKIGKGGTQFGFDTENKSVSIDADFDGKYFDAGVEFDGSNEDGVSASVEVGYLGLKGKYTYHNRGPLPDTWADTIALPTGPKDYFQYTYQIDRVLTKPGHPLHDPERVTVLQSKTTTHLTALGKTHYKEIKVSTLLDSGKYRNVTAEKMSSPEFDKAHQTANDFVEVIGVGSMIQRSYRDQIVDNLKGRFKDDPNKPSDQAIKTSAQRYTDVYGKGLRNIESGPFEAKAIENGLYDALKAGVSVSNNAKLLDAINLHMAEVPAAVEKMLEVNAQALAQQALQVQKQEFDQRVNIIEHKVAYENLQSELMRAGAPEALLRDIAQGSIADPGGVNPSMGAAMMRGLEGISVVNDVRFSALDKLAGEHARLEYERTGDAVAATQAGVDAVRAAKEANTGQAPLSGLSNEQVAEKAVQGYRDNLMKGSLTVESGNYAGPSKEHSPEDLMTFEQNQQQLARNEAKRLAAKTQREAPKATAKAPPQTPRTVTLNVARQDYLSGQTQQGAARAARRNIDTTGLNVDLLNIAVPKMQPGQYEVTLGGWSPVRTLAALNRPTAKRTPSRKASMTTAHQKALDARYGYKDPNDPNTPQNQKGYRSFGGWMNAMKDAVSTGWYGDPNKNPNTSVIETGVAQTGTSAQGLIDAQENIDKEQARRQKQERQKQQKEPAPTTESDEQSTTMTSNTKTDLLGGSVNATLSGPQALGGGGNGAAAIP